MADDRCAMRDELQFLGFNTSEPIVDKCLEICSEFNCTPEALLEEWIGYAAGHLKGKLDPTLDGLDAFARRQTVALKGLGGKKTIQPVQKSDIIVYDQPPEVKSILEAYTSGKPKSDSPNKRISHNVNQASSFVPASYSPIAGKSSESYRKRTDSGQVITSYDPKNHLSDTEKRITLNKNIDIQLLDLGNNNSITKEKYMFDIMETEVSAAVNRIDRISQLLIKKNDMKETDQDSDLSIIEHGKIECGRIRSEGDGRLNISSVLLEQRDGRLSRINLINQKSYSFFPGQIIAMKTSTLIGPNRSQFLPTEMHTDVTPELSKLKPDIKGGGPLNVIVASGPFTLFDNLTYEPLQDLITYVKKEKPDVLILIGPFVDSRHVSIADGSLAESFNTHFDNILNCALLPLKDYDVEIILIPSTLDAHHHPIYPTPPYIFENKLLKNIHQMPDPALFTINDIVIGATSVDVLFHLAKTELSFQAKNKDRMARFTSHLLSQQTFYPLNPAMENLCVDHGLLEKHGQIPVLPHLMIVPSNFGKFIKVVDSCIVINPERLSKGYVGGTFARIEIYPNEAGPLENITCQIIKI